MTKTFCDVCGKELTSLEELNVYCVSIVKQHKMGYAPLTRKYPEVCEDCTKRLLSLLMTLKLKIKKAKNRGCINTSSILLFKELLYKSVSPNIFINIFDSFIFNTKFFF